MKFFFNCQEWFFKAHMLLFFWFFQGTVTIVYGQSFSFQHFTEKEGLTSTYLYGALQDEKGHLWLTGESGVLWYDGQEFEIPEIEKELKDEVIRMFKGDAKRVWMQDLASQILVYEGGKIRRFPEINSGLIYRYIEVYNHPTEEIWISDKENVFVYKPELDSLIQLEVNNQDENLVSLKAFGQTEDGQTIMLTRKGYHLFDGYSDEYVQYKDGMTRKEFTFGFQKAGKLYVVLDNKVYYFNLETGQYEQYLEQFDEYFSAGLIEAFEDADGDVWFSTRDGLLLLQSEEDGTLKMTKHLEGEVMGGTIQDSEGNLWFITEHNGLFLLTSKEVKVYYKGEVEQQIRFVRKNIKGQLVLGFDNNQFKILDESFELILSKKIFEQNNRLYDLVINENGDQYFITSKGYVQFDKDYNLKHEIGEWSFKSGAFTPDGKLWLATGSFFGFIKEGQRPETILKKRCYSLLPISNDKIWVGAIEGLFLYENGTCEKN